MLFVLRGPATRDQIEQMLEVFGSYIKLAVDVQREIVAGGGEMHADCEQALLADGSRQADVWGADWDMAGEVRFESLINIRPGQGNRSMEVQSPELRKQIEQIVRRFFEAE